MDKYRRKNQINDFEINCFKQEEIDRLILNTRIKPRMFKLNKSIPLMLSFVTVVLLIFLSFLIFKPNESKDYNIIKLNDFQYLLESETENELFRLYYSANIVTLGVRENYNDKFDYYVPYNYVSKDIIEKFDISFNAFKLDRYRYFLEVIIDNESTYLEVNFFSTTSIENILTNLEIVDFQKDIQEVFKLIEQYPPIINVNASQDWLYDINPNINPLTDSRHKRNYINYVRNYYVHENHYQPEEYNENYFQRLTVFENHIIVVDEFGNMISSHFDFAYSFGQTQDLSATFSNLNYFFDFYEIGQTRPTFGATFGFNSERHAVEGKIRTLIYQEQTYAYTLISLKNSDIPYQDIEYIKINYEFVEELSRHSYEITLDYFIYNQALIIPPSILLPFSWSEDLFNQVTYEMFNSNGDVVHTIVYN